jgi:hypothetical protein
MEVRRIIMSTIPGLDVTAYIDDAECKSLLAKGIKWVACYYFYQSAFKRLLNYDEAVILSKYFWVVSVYENGSPTTAAYFTTKRGMFDLSTALSRANAAKQPNNTSIYFTVDYDASESDLVAIKAYFEALQPMRKTYLLGIYGSGMVCKFLKDAGLVDKTWLSQSTGFPGYTEWLSQADIVQGRETTVDGLDVDLDTSMGNAGGWKI